MQSTKTHTLDQFFASNLTVFRSSIPRTPFGNRVTMDCPLKFTSKDLMYPVYGPALLNGGVE